MDLPVGLGPGLRGAVAADERDTGALARWTCPLPNSTVSTIAGRTPSLQLAVTSVPPDGLPVPAGLTWHHGAVGKPAETGRASVVWHHITALP